MANLKGLVTIGATPEACCCRLALSDADRAERDQVVVWMRELDLQARIDPIGNIFGHRARRQDLSPVMTGSHIDTVRTGGCYDGNYGVLAGLGVVQALSDADVKTRRPLVVAVFTKEEGARFQPDMLGSLVCVGGMPLTEAHARRAIDGPLLGEELRRIGYLGDAPVLLPAPHAFVELHNEQGPVLDTEGITIVAVHDLQAISWQALTITGQSNHACTTPMRLRHDAGYCVAAVACFVRSLADEMGGNQVATVGFLNLLPNLINVIAARAQLTVDLRETSEAPLQQAERRLADFVDTLAEREGVRIEVQRLSRFGPVMFDAGVADLIACTATRLGHSQRAMISGAGHDAQMLARLCPSAMIFVPSVKGISHNGAEYTDLEHLAVGAEVLLHTLLELAD
jgi:N-carbamoyl-L-amino-acid hydrolase